MELYLIRHGLAQPLGHKNDFADEKRTLTWAKSPGASASLQSNLISS